MGEGEARGTGTTPEGINEPLESSATRLLLDPDRKWLLVVGTRLGAPSGVPLPTRRTRWSPSLQDIVHIHVFKTHSRQIFESLQDEEVERPPLGFIADSLDEQDSWLSGYLKDLSPSLSFLRVADMARSGMFRAVVTNAPDRLLEKAFQMVGVPFQAFSPREPSLVEPGVLPLLRDWDDRIFQDTEDRLAQERAFIESRLEELLKAVDGVLVLGHTPRTFSFMKSVTGALAHQPDLDVVQVEWRDEEEVAGEGVDLIQEISRSFHHQAVEDGHGHGSPRSSPEGAKYRSLGLEPSLLHTNATTGYFIKTRGP